VVWILDVGPEISLGQINRHGPPLPVGPPKNVLLIAGVLLILGRQVGVGVVLGLDYWRSLVIE